MSVSLVAAVSRNGVIGRDGKLPWRIPADLKLFRKLTLGKPIIMGRKTYDSIGHPLDQRTNIVISRQPREWPEGVMAVASFEAAVALARQRAACTGAGEIMVIGGEQVFRSTLPIADRIYLTRVDRDYPGDTYFPALAPNDWIETESVPLERGDPGEPPATFVVLDRRHDC